MGETITHKRHCCGLSLTKGWKRQNNVIYISFIVKYSGVTLAGVSNAQKLGLRYFSL